MPNFDRSQGRNQPRRYGGAPASGRLARGWVQTKYKSLPLCRGVRGSRPPDFFLYIFNTKSCILMHSLTPKMDTISVFIKTLCTGGKEDCRLPNEAQRAAMAKIEAEGLDCCPLPKVLREGAASPTS